MRFIYALLFLFFLNSTTAVSAQTVVNDSVKKSGKTQVSVPVTVSDREGRYITGLKKGDFTLYEDGVEQPISSFAAFDEPVNVALLLDTSGSTRETLDQIKSAAKDFIELLNPNDQCLIATFDARVNVLSQLTSDHKLLKKSLTEAQTAEKAGSVVFNAVEQLAQTAFNGAEGRKVIVLLTDGKDFGSSLSKKQLFDDLEESDVSIYPIFYKTGAGFNKIKVTADGTVTEAKPDKKKKEKKPKKQKKNYSILIPMNGNAETPAEIKLRGEIADVDAVGLLTEMSDATAGRFYQSDAPNLSGIFKRIAGEIRQQYRLAYRSKNTGKVTVHEIRIKVSRTDAVIHARGKYRAEQL